MAVENVKFFSKRSQKSYFFLNDIPPPPLLMALPLRKELFLRFPLQIKQTIIIKFPKEAGDFWWTPVK